VTRDGRQTLGHTPHTSRRMTRVTPHSLMPLSIRWKVTLGTLFAVALGLAVAGWVSISSIETIELTRLKDTLHAQTTLAALTLQPLLQQEDLRGPSLALQALAKEIGRRSFARVTVIAADGTVLADSATDDRAVARMDNHATRPEVVQAWASGEGATMRLSETTGQRTLYLAHRLDLAGQPENRLVIVRLGLPMTQIEAQLRELKQRLTLALGLAFLVAVALGMVIARSLTRPLSDMARVARKLAAGAPGQRVPVTSQDEIGILARALNDMTDQLEAKIHELSDDRAQLLAVLVSMVEGVMVLDCRGVVLQVNPALERMFTLKPGETKGRPYWEVIRHHELNELTARVLERRTSLGGELTLTPSGHQLRVEASVTACAGENEPCAVLVFHDVTAVRRLEKVRKDFVANVSHELRTPLTSIRGYVEALLDGGKDDPDTLVRFLDIILKQSHRLELILEDLLQLSQIESGQVLFKREPVALGTIIERTVALIKPMADKKNHALAVRIADDLPPVIGDEDRLVQVLTNLLDNAVKYTPPAGAITVAARALRVRMADGSDAEVVELTVTDTGVGIPEADRPRVFERFYRVDKARSRELGGTGLGLAIVKHIVEGHGGQVWVEGNEPVGSRFVVRLPAAGERTASAQSYFAAKT
jgi:two-component system phosphate regulon sensor histidine kinase PhoR